MNQKDLRKLNRQELLELLLTQSKKIDRLQAKLNQTEAQLKERNVTIKEAGSIAEASIKLSGVFEAAQEASDFYISQCRSLYEQAQKEYDAIISEAKFKAGEIIKGAVDPKDVDLDFGSDDGFDGFKIMDNIHELEAEPEKKTEEIPISYFKGLDDESDDEPDGVFGKVKNFFSGLKNNISGRSPSRRNRNRR